MKLLTGVTLGMHQNIAENNTGDAGRVKMRGN
jgi:hypothetical protein